MIMTKLIGVIMAAGLGKRMNSKTPKVLHTLMGKPLIEFPLKALRELNPDGILVILGNQIELIKEQLGERYTYILQDPPLGTGDALKQILPYLREYLDNAVLVVPGDAPFINSNLLKEFTYSHQNSGCQASILTTIMENPSGYGRIIRDENGSIVRIIEDSDLTSGQKNIKEVNASVYIFRALALLKYLPQIDNQNQQGEYYLTDIFEKMTVDKQCISIFCYQNTPEMLMGINNRKDLVKAHKLLKEKIIEGFLDSGVTIIDPESTYIEDNVSIEQDVTIYPFSFLMGNTVIKSGSIIGPSVLIKNSVIGNGCKIYYSEIEEATLEQGVKVGPFSHLRPGTYVKQGAKIGNFAELKKSVIGENTRVSHVSYLGDSNVGDGVNIGAGTIVCNYDGEKKHPTVIEDEVFVGSNSTLIAPLRIGKGAYIAGGSVINNDVPPEALALGRGIQVIKEGWAKKRKERRKNNG
ncbi:MAG: Bifunctional protein GlmU [candidate division WS2 bacterium]|uniref:Bifunctional protein GlmU n=1 Tax=Psychracetigena formicireducens TaxID=2986056 RepID=A0A9E2BH81_PSYF1|nr:Bifunctional protein GlmU [Candidatus Psychracetigena formicireducens]MBT9145487.1 Bifunctional protein GlmU [Candidatus Psychracetigena formicireducens]MBT9151623.1 Bifunctional protein GlmU [Candidatus Psychracetigena formicireducens]